MPASIVFAIQNNFCFADCSILVFIVLGLSQESLMMMMMMMVMMMMMMMTMMIMICYG